MIIRRNWTKHSHYGKIEHSSATYFAHTAVLPTKKYERREELLFSDWFCNINIAFWLVVHYKNRFLIGPFQICAKQTQTQLACVRPGTIRTVKMEDEEVIFVRFRHFHHVVLVVIVRFLSKTQIHTNLSELICAYLQVFPKRLKSIKVVLTKSWTACSCSCAIVLTFQLHFNIVFACRTL